MTLDQFKQNSFAFHLEEVSFGDDNRDKCHQFQFFIRLFNANNNSF